MFGDECGRSGFDPWRELNRLQEELNRLFSGTRTGQVGGFPPVNVWTGDEGGLVTADMPGFEPDGFEISVLDESVTLRGKRDPGAEKEGGTFHRRERYHGEFNRTINLPFKVDVDAVTAAYKNGELRIILPRAQEDKARKVNVTAD